MIAWGPNKHVLLHVLTHAKGAKLTPLTQVRRKNESHTNAKSHANNSKQGSFSTSIDRHEILSTTMRTMWKIPEKPIRNKQSENMRKQKHSARSSLSTFIDTQ